MVLSMDGWQGTLTGQQRESANVRTYKKQPMLQTTCMSELILAQTVSCGTTMRLPDNSLLPKPDTSSMIAGQELGNRTDLLVVSVNPNPLMVVSRWPSSQ